jgi:hypothetical protein
MTKYYPQEMRDDERHSFYLSNLVRNLGLVGVKHRNIQTVIKEPEWFYGPEHQQHELCDLLVGLNDRTFVPIELKGSKGKRDKALSQIASGHEYCHKVFRATTNFGLFVVYLEPGKYYFEAYDSYMRRLR